VIGGGGMVTDIPTLILMVLLPLSVVTAITSAIVGVVVRYRRNAPKS
jgi:hypothetical protein